MKSRSRAALLTLALLAIPLACGADDGAAESAEVAAAEAPPNLEGGPVFIRSVANESLVLRVEDWPPAESSPVTLQSVSPDDWYSPSSQWVLQQVAAGLYLIELFSSGGELFLESADDMVGAAIQVGPIDPSSTGQLWRVEPSSSPQHLSPEGSDRELGFPGSVGVPGLPLTLQPAGDGSGEPDQFTLDLVWD